MMSSPKKKKIKLVNTGNLTHNKRVSESTEESSKRHRADGEPKEDIHAKKRRNFIAACELVSYKAYYDHHLRFLLKYLPPCAEQLTCTHNHHKYGMHSNKVMPSYAEESFRIEMKANMWCEALEVCRLCITPNQYLPANILKDIMEIMLNAHDDEHDDYTIDYLLDKCQQVFEFNISYHPPCVVKSLRKCYADFLTSPLELKVKSFTNRAEFGCDKGIVKYCLNRLEYEISLHSKDEPLVDKYMNIPDEMKQSVTGLHWKKEKFEIYELLERTERIKRLLAVLETIVELLQCDLAIWHTRYTNNLGNHIMRSHKPLMAFLLWPDNVLYTGAVNNNCRQILRLFVYMIHLQYPENHINTMVAWLNTMIQTFYVCENNSNSDYPNVGKYCTTFANEFYKIIAEMPHETVIRVLERIKPDYMQCLIGSLHIRGLLRTKEENPIKLFTEFLQNSQWKKFPQNTSEVKIFRKTSYSARNILKYLKKKSIQLNNITFDVEMENEVYYRFDPLSVIKDSETTLNHVIHTLYVTLEAFLDAYSVQNMQETLDKLNEKVQNGDSNDLYSKLLPDFCSYSVTEKLIKHYRSIYQLLKELLLVFQDIKNNGNLPNIFSIFEKIGLLGL